MTLSMILTRVLHEIWHNILLLVGFGWSPDRIPHNYYLPVPPAVADDPAAYAQSNFGLSIAVLISLAWGYYEIREMAAGREHIISGKLGALLKGEGRVVIKRRDAIDHPRTVLRVALIGVFLSAVLRNAPDVYLNWSWKEMSPWTRYEVAHWNRVLDGWSSLPFILGWIAYIAGRPVIETQLGREPIPVELYLRASKLLRPLGIVAIALWLSIAIAYTG